MRTRPLGKTGLQVSEISHGTWAMGFMWGERNDPQALQALKRGLESGVNFIDTAFIYGRGHSERLIGQLIRETGVKPMIASKIPPDLKSWPPKEGSHANEAFSAKYIRKITEMTLDNLGVDCLDLQQLHVWRPEWLGQGEWQETILRLKEEGKIRHFGVSLNDHDPDSGLELVASGLVESIQVIFNLFDQTPREKLFPACIKNGVGVLVRVPLDEGGLAGTFTPETTFPKGDWRKKYFEGKRLQETIDHANQFKFLTRGEIQSLAQAALKFCLSEPAVSTVIAGMRTVPHVESNTAVSDFEDLTPEELTKAYQLSWPRNFYPQHG